MVMVAVLNAPLACSTQCGKIFVAQADDRLALLDCRGLDDAHGIREHIIDICTTRGHQRRSGHDALEIIDRVDNQDHVPHLACLAIGVNRQQS